MMAVPTSSRNRLASPRRPARMALVMGVAGVATSDPATSQEVMLDPSAFQLAPSQAMICPLEVR